ncbi:MAG: polysaccharide deacetylase family protein [Deltaproteobacteria bacterium]|nr:polysaccharide deacetylase family protein [Deltaproteobacteria bacterium]
MPGTFIISFDCEGKWGISHHLSDGLRVALTNANLNKTYEHLLELLDRHNIKATFAFVGAFTMSIEEYFAHQDLFADVWLNGKSWLESFKQEAALQCFEGWLNPTAFKLVAQESQHEIAAHGFTHVPLIEFFVSREEFLREMAALQRISSFRNRAEMTFVYPINMIGYTEELKRAGFIGYREVFLKPNLSTNRLIKYFDKIRNVCVELNVKQQSQPHPPAETLVRIPSGFVLTWLYGLKKQMPASLIIQRWKNIIADAVSNNRVVHLYTHPHNFITGNRMYEILAEILHLIEQRQRRGEIINLTQKEYVKAITQKTISLNAMPLTQGLSS